MAVTITPYLNHHSKEDGKSSIYIRITNNRRHAHISLGIAISRKYWNKKTRRVRTGTKLTKLYNKRIDEVCEDLEAISLRLPLNVAPRTVKRYYENGGLEPRTIEQGFRDLIKHKEPTVTGRTLARYRTTMKKAVSFFGNDMMMGEFTKHDLFQFQDHLYRTVKVSTANKTLTVLGQVFKLAGRNDYIRPSDSPFQFLEKRSSNFTKSRLTLEEINSLIELQELPKKQEHARDIFIFQFFCAGMRIGDALTLTPANIEGDRLTYIMGKTKKQKALTMPPEAIVLAKKYSRHIKDDDYLFPYLTKSDRQIEGYRFDKKVEAKTALVNKYLKIIAKKAGISKKVSTHLARHSFADLARQKSKDLYGVSKALGHSDLKVTQNYLNSLDENSVDELMAAVFSPQKEGADKT